MIRRLLMLGAIAWVAWLVGRAFRSTKRPDAGGADRRAGERAGGPMVRDRVCNTFVPRSAAITLRLDGAEHHFCSGECRERFLLARGDSVDRPA